MGEERGGVRFSRALEPHHIEHEVEGIRTNIDIIVSELDRRRREFLDWRLQMRKHAWWFGAAAAVLAVGIGATIALSVMQSRRRARPMAKARRWRSAFSRMIEHPEWLAREEPGVGKRAVVAAASAFSGGMAKGAAARLMARRELAD
jgi:hypothetical protein